MKKTIQIALCVFCAVIIISLLLTVSVHYATNCKKTLRDTSVSPDGKYDLSLVEIGEPAWPFGAASGRLILNAGNAIISQKDFELHNDGCQIGRDNWKVAWNENHVEVILSGEEQFDEQICLYYDGAITRQYLMDTTVPPQTDPIPKLDIAVTENRENELVFDISIKDYIDSFNSFYFQNAERKFLADADQWQCFTYDSAIHSPYETDCYYFREDENIYNEPTISVYVPSNADYIQEITINFDEHGYTESGFAQYKQLCYCTMKVFFPDLDDTEIQELCIQIITLGNQNVFDSDAWYSSTSVPYALFYKDGIGIYPYFAIGDWEHFCIIPVTENTIQTFEEKGVLIYEIG